MFIPSTESRALRFDSEGLFRSLPSLEADRSFAFEYLDFPHFVGLNSHLWMLGYRLQLRLDSHRQQHTQGHL